MKVKSRPGFRLLALNLALILLCTVCLPIMASAASGSYDIYVGTTHFKSTESASGSGWAYDPDYGILVLSGYNGGPIYADGGDLFIASSGNNTVTGNRSQGGRQEQQHTGPAGHRYPCGSGQDASELQSNLRRTAVK